MAGLLSIAEPNASRPTDPIDNQNSLNNDLLARLATDATKSLQASKQYSREDIAALLTYL